MQAPLTLPEIRRPAVDRAAARLDAGHLGAGEFAGLFSSPKAGRFALNPTSGLKKTGERADETPGVSALFVVRLYARGPGRRDVGEMGVEAFNLDANGAAAGKVEEDGASAVARQARSGLREARRRHLSRRRANSSGAPTKRRRSDSRRERARTDRASCPPRIPRRTGWRRRRSGARAADARNRRSWRRRPA